MPVILDINSNAKSVAEIIGKYGEAFPKDVATALSRTASKAKKDLVSKVPDYIDRPTRFTLMGFYSKGASKNNLVAEVGTKDATDYYRQHHSLKAQIFGGDRAIRGSERRLRVTGMLASNEYLAPGPAAHLDKHGNMPGTKMVQLLSQIRALSIAGQDGYTANRTEGSKSKAFFGTINGQKGIWERRGKRNIRLMVSAIKAPSYTPKFPMVEIIQKFFDANIEREFWEAYEQGKKIRENKTI